MLSRFCVENDRLMVRLAKEEQLDAFAVGMVENNVFSQIIKFDVERQNADIAIVYQLGDKVPMNTIFEDGVSALQMKKLLQSWIALINEADEYMVDIGSFVLDSKYIYYDVQNQQFSFICQPSLQRRQSNDLRELLKTLLFSVEYQPTQAHAYLPILMNAMRTQPTFALDDLQVLVEHICTVPENNISPENYSKEAMEFYLSCEEEEVENTSEDAMDVPQPHAEEKQEMPTQVLTPVQEVLETACVEPIALECDAADLMPLPLQAEVPLQDDIVVQGVQAPQAEQARYVPRDSSMEYSGIEQNVVLVGASSQEVLGSFNQSTSEEPSEVIEQERLVYAETTTLNENVLRVKADTVVLSQYEAYYQSSPHLVRQKTGEKVPVVSARFSLGKDRSMVNYAVPDNGAISRCHAEILTREGARGKMYLILDEKSTNHTYVNDQMLNKGVACEIKHGTQIKLADEAFVFYER